MNSLLKPKPQKDPSLRKGVLAVFLFAIILLGFSLLGSSKSYATLGAVAKPFWTIKQNVVASLGSTLASFQSKQTLVAENKDLQSRLQQTESLQAENVALQSENNLLKQLNADGTGEVGRVITNPAGSFFDIVSIALPPHSVTKPGAIVYAEGGTAIGTVTEVGGGLAKVELFSSSGKTTDAVLEQGNVPLQLSGLGAGSFLAIVPRDLPIGAGDVVTLPTYRSAVLGVVGSVEHGRSDSFQNVYISYPFNVFDISWVRIYNAN